MSRKIALSGILTAFCVLCLYLAGLILPIKEFLLCFSSVFLTAVVIECGVKYSLVVFIASSLLGFFIIPNKLLMIPFILFLGYYPIIKLKIEQIHSLPKEWLLKYLVFNGAGIVAFFILQHFLSLPVQAVLIGTALAEVLFFVYDYALSLAIGFYLKRIKKRG